MTNNLKDFQNLPDGLEAQSADEFLCNLFDLDRDAMAVLLRQQAAQLKKPARTFEQLLDALAKTVPDFASAVRAHVAT